MSVERPFDAVVVGAGIVGSYLASLLAEQGRRVALVEHGPAAPGEGVEPRPPITCTARDHEGVRLARHHVVGGNSSFWGGGLIRNRPGEAAPLLGDAGLAPGALDEHYAAVERAIGVRQAPGRGPGPGDLPAGWQESRILVLTGRARNIARGRLARASREPGFHLLADCRVEALAPGANREIRSIGLTDAQGRKLELAARQIVVCAGAADSVLFFQRFARELGIYGHPLLGARLHDHFSIPLFQIRAAGRGDFVDEFAPAFTDRLIVGRRLELEIEDPAGWNPCGFLHFPCEFDAASPYRELKALIDMRQAGGALPDYLRALAGAVAALPSTLRVGFHRFVRKKLYVSPAVPVVATLDFESFPSRDNRLVLTTGQDGTERADFDWDLRDEDVRAFARFYPRVVEAMELLARHFSFTFEPVESLAAARTPEDHLARGVHDIYHLGGGVQAGATAADGVLRPDLRLHTVGNVHMVASAAFRRPGIGNPVHTLLALADRLARRLD